MLDGTALRAAVEKHQPDVIVPEIEAIDTATLPSSKPRAGAWRLGQGRAADHEPRRHPRFRRQRARPRHLQIPLRRKPRRGDRRGASEVGLPCVVKPVMSSSGKGQTTARTAEEVGAAWDYAVAKMRGDRPRVIVEELIDVRQRDHAADRRDQGRRIVLRAGRPSPGSRRLSRKLAAGGDPARGALHVGAAPGAQGRRGAGRPRHLRRRILHPRRPGDLLRDLARARTTPAWSP